MAHTKTCEAVVLQVHDVGEADRFCILLTREYGKLAARARGVRKLKSRMGGSILPLHSVTVELHEGSTGFLITGVHDASPLKASANVHAFMQAMQGIELIIQLIEEGEEVPEVFDTTKEFLTLCSPQCSIVLPFTIRLLSVLGLLPTTANNDTVAQMSPSEKTFYLHCTQATWGTRTDAAEVPRLQQLCDNIIEQQNFRELRAGRIAKGIVLSSA